MIHVWFLFGTNKLCQFQRETAFDAWGFSLELPQRASSFKEHVFPFLTIVRNQFFLYEIYCKNIVQTKKHSNNFYRLV